MNKDGKASISARQGTYMVGAVNCIASLLATQTVKSIGRVKLLLWGHTLMFVAHFVIGFADLKHNDGVVLTFLLIFIFIYQNSSGPVAWLYFTETCVDSAMGVTLAVLWFTVYILSLITPILMNEPKDGGIGPQNVFFMFSGLCFSGTVYSYFFMKETMGLSDLEKK